MVPRRHQSRLHADKVGGAMYILQIVIAGFFVRGAYRLTRRLLRREDASDEVSP